MFQNGFTLIELLVVVAIIGVISVVGIVSYNGFITKAKESACIDQHKIIKDIIKFKFIDARMESGPSIRHSGSFCFQYFMNGGQPGDLQQQIAENNASPIHCNTNRQTVLGSEHFYAKEVAALGITNCTNELHEPYISNCGWNCNNALGCPAMAAPGYCAPGLSAGSAVPESAKVRGVTIFACGEQAGLSNPNKCYLGTRVSDNEVIEEFLTK